MTGSSLPPGGPGGSRNVSHEVLRGFAFELMHVAGRSAIDGNSPRLHRLGDFPEQLDFQQAVLERGALT